MNEQEIRQLYDRYKPNVPFEQFAQDMQDPEIRSSFLRSTMANMVGSAAQAVKQSTIPVDQRTDVQPQPESMAQEEAPVQDFANVIPPPKDRPFVGARPEETPFRSPAEIVTKYPQPSAQAEVDFATAVTSPKLLNAELNRIRTAPISEEPTPAVGIAKKLTEAESLYAKAVKEKTNILKYNYNNFIKSRVNEYAGSIQSEEDRKIIEQTIQEEADFFLQNEAEKIKTEVKPFYDAYSEVYNSDMNQMAMKNPTMANAYYRERSQAYSQMGTGERSLRNILVPALSGFQSTIADVLPGMWSASMALRDDQTYEEAVADKYMRENRLNYGMARQRMAPGQQMQDPEQWKQEIAKKAVQEEISNVGQEKFNQDKEEFEKAQAARRALRLEYAYEQQGEAAGKMSSFAPSWEESSGILGVSEYVQRTLGQTAAFAVPTIIGSALGGSVGGFAAGGATMFGVESGSAYVEAIDALREKYPKLSTEEILRLKLDEPYQDAAVRTGIINAALEQVSNLTMIGKFIPKTYIVKFIDKLIDSTPGKITIGSAVEGTTELVQKKNQRYQQYLADGMSHYDALEKALAQDDTEEAIAGAVGGGGMSTIAAFFNNKKKAMADAITSKFSTGDPELDAKIDRDAKEAQLIKPPKGDLGNVKTQQAGVPSGEQQGQAPIEEGTQPQGSGAEAATGGVLQVSPETPGEATVTPSPYGIQRTSVVPKEGDKVTELADENTIKDEKGTPIIYYHGTTKESANSIRQNGFDLTKGRYGESSGISLTKNEKQAYSNKGDVVKAIISLKNPMSFAMNFQIRNEIAKRLAGKTTDQFSVSDWNKYESAIEKEFNKEAKRLGYDGVYDKNQSEVLIFDPSSIKIIDQSSAPTMATPQPVTSVVPQGKDLVSEGEKELEGIFGEPVTEQAPPTEQATVTPEVTQPETTTTEPSYVFTIDANGNVIRAEVTAKGDQTSSIKFEDGRRTTRVNSELFNTEQEARDYVTKTGEVPAANVAYVVDKRTGQVQQGTIVRKNDKAITVNVNGKNTYLQPNEVFTTEQEAKDYATSIAPTTTAPTRPTEQPTGNLNDFKKYFFNKDPKAFGNQLATALGMTQDGWKQAYKKFSKNATPEELKMLDALIGRQAAEPVTQPTTEVTEEEENVTLVDKQGLLDAGYTEAQVQMIFDSPDVYGQIDNKIVNMETNEVIAPKGKKKAAPPRPRRPKQEEKFPKTTFADFEKAMTTPGVKMDELLRIVAGLGSEYSDLAKQLLKLYKENRYVKLVKFSTTHLENENKRAGGLYDPATNILSVFVDKLRKYVRKQNPKAPESTVEKKATQLSLETFIHEVLHAFTIRQLVSAIPATRYNRFRNQEALNAYLKNGENNAIKDLIKLYNKALSVAKTRDKQGKGEQTSKSYGFKNIHEFVTESFANPDFQEILNTIDSPIAANKTMWQSFVDAVRSILKLKTTEPLRKGSVLEAVMRTVPSIMVTEAQAGEMGQIMASPVDKAKYQQSLPAFVKIAKGLIQKKQATYASVIDEMQKRYGDRLGIDMQDYADDILAELTPPTATTEFDAEASVAEFTNSPYSQFTATATNRQDIEEKVADFLRGKVSDKEQVVDFAAAWNDTLAVDPATGKVDSNKKFLSGDINRIWNRLRTDTKAPKGEKVATIREVIEAQWNARAKGKAEGVRWSTKEFKDNLLKAVQEAIKASPVTLTQAQAMISAVRRVNFFTPGSISKLKQRLAQIQESAEYAQKLRDARSNKRELSRLAKSTTGLSNLVSAAKGLKSVDIDYLENNDIDEYLKHTNDLIAAFKPVLRGYEGTYEYDLSEYINRQNAHKEKMQLIEQGVDEAKAAEVVDGISTIDLAEIAGDELSLRKALLLEEAEGLQQQLADPTTIEDKEGLYVDFNSKEFKALVNADLNKLGINELSAFIKVADNIIYNGDNSALTQIANHILANDSVTEMQDGEIGKAAKYKISQLLNLDKLGLEQMTQIIDSAFRSNKLSAIFYNKSGIYDYFRATTKRELRVLGALEKLKDTINKIDRSKMGMGRRSLMLKEEQAKLLMLSELSKYAVNSKEHIAKVHDNIAKSIERWAKKDEDFAKDLQSSYDKYKNVKTAEEAIELFKKNDPHVHALWEHMTSEMYSDSFTQEMEDNTKSVHNRTFLRFQNYMPTALIKVGKDPDIQKESKKNAGLAARPADSTIAATRNLNIDQAYSFDNYITRVIGSYQSAVHDIETSSSYQLVTNILKKSELEELFGNSNNLNILIDKVKSTETLQRNMGEENDALLKIANYLGNAFATIGTATALGGVDQLFLQYPTAAVSGMIQLGKDWQEFFAAPMDQFSDPKLREEVKKLLGEQDIAVRGKLQQIDIETKNFSIADKNKIVDVVKKVGNVGIWLQRNMLLKPLLYSDMSVAERLYIAFYMKSLKEQGITNIDLKTEMQYKDDASRKQAFAYASYMISNLLVSSSGAGRAQVVQNPGWQAFMRRMFFPFVSFPLNTRIRLLHAVQKMRVNPNEGAKELSGVIAEVSAFNGIRTWILPIYYAAIKAGLEEMLGYEPPEEEDQPEKNKFRQWYTANLLDVIPWNLGLFSWPNKDLLNYINFKMTETEAKTLNQFLKKREDEGEILEKMPDFSKYNQFWGWGTYGIGLDRVADTFSAISNNFSSDTIVINEGEMFEKVLDNRQDQYDDLMRQYLILQLAPLPREIRSQGNKIYREQLKKIKKGGQSNEMPTSVMF